MSAPQAALLMIGGDPYIQYVTYLCHFDSSSGSPRAFVQSSVLGQPIANQTGTVPDVSSAQYVFGGFSLAYAASGNNRVLSNSSAYQAGSGDFTLEFWTRLGAIPAGTYTLVDQRTSPGTGFTGFAILARASGVVTFFTGGADRITSANSTMVATTWQHVAACRSGTSTRLFVDGLQVGSTYSDSNSYTDSSFMVGAAFNGGNPALSSYFDEVRLTRGYARYTANFTVPTAPFPNF